MQFDKQFNDKMLLINKTFDNINYFEEKMLKNYIYIVLEVSLSYITG